MLAKTPTSLPVRKVADIVNSYSWAIYGRSGSGKTTFSGTFPAPILLLDFRDRGTDSVKEVKDLHVMEIEDWEEIEEVYLYLVKNPTKYKTVVFDTITQMQGIAMEHVLAKKKKRVNTNLGDWGTMTMREWGDVAALMKEKITSFRDLPLEVAFLAQERLRKEDGDDDDDMLVPEVGPALTPSVASHLNASVSIIGNTFIRVRRKVVKKEGKKTEHDEMRYCLRLGAHSIYTTKVRKPRDIEVPSFIENPIHKDVVDILTGKE
jgi:AAA domain